MDFFNTATFLNSSVLIGGEDYSSVSQGQDATNTEVSATTAIAPVAGDVSSGEVNTGGFMNSNYFMIAYIIGLICLFYFFAIRPQKKREKEQKDMLNSIGIGDSVMTSGGFFGKVIDASDEVFVVEFGTNKGVRIPVRKSEIVAKKEPNMTSASAAE